VTGKELPTKLKPCVPEAALTLLEMLYNLIGQLKEIARYTLEGFPGIIVTRAD